MRSTERMQLFKEKADMRIMGYDEDKEKRKNLLKRYDMRVPNSSRLYQSQKNRVIEGNKQPSKNPRSRRTTQREA